MKKKVNAFLILFIGMLFWGTSDLIVEAASVQLSNPVITTKKKTTSNLHDVSTWDCIYFGNYPQSQYFPANVPSNPEEGRVYTDSNGIKFVYLMKATLRYPDKGRPYMEKSKIGASYYKIEPIKWRVLSLNGNDVFLISDLCLDTQPYHDLITEDEGITRENLETSWETCTLRKWLNDTFLKTAFSDLEIKEIKDTIVVNEDSHYDDEVIDGGNNTVDKVYCLSYSEALNTSYGFIDAYARYAANTDFAIQSGAHTEEDLKPYCNASSYYWLRSPGSGLNSASTVWTSCYSSFHGGVDYANGGADNLGNSVRPVIHLSLSSASWISAGTIDSDCIITGGSIKANGPKVNGTILNISSQKCNVKVTSSSTINPTVSYTKSTNSKAKTITIPDTVTVDDITYKVTSIANNALANNKKLTKVTVGKNVTSIGKNAFKKCTKLKTVTIKSTSLKSIGASAFYGDKNLKTITIKSTKLTSKSIGKNAFKGTNKKLTIKVPKKKIASYKKFLKKKGNKKVKIKKG